MSPNAIPNEEQIEALLSEVRLEPGAKLERRLRSAPWTPQAAARRRGVAVLSIALLALALLMAGTPLGRAWAEQFFHFFPTATSNSFPLSTQEMEMAAVPGQSVQPIFDVKIAPVSPWASRNLIGGQAMITPVPLAGCDDPILAYQFACQAANAEALAGFQAKHLPGDTNDWFFKGAWGIQETQEIWFSYQAVSFLGTHANLTISQGVGDFPAEDKWSAVPESAIKSVHVGDYPAEYVQGGFVVFSGTTAAVWSSDDLSQRLRWKEGQRWFEIDEENAYWLKPGVADLVALAKSMTYERGAYQQRVNPNDMTSFKDAETVTGFDLLEPGLLPEDFHLANLRYDAKAQELRAQYLFKGALYLPHAGGLVVTETPLGAVSPDRLPEAHLLDATGRSPLGDGIGIYMLAPSKEPWTMDDSFTVWKPDVPQLIWKQGGLLVEMYYYAVPDYGGRLNESDMLTIAKSFK